MGNYLSLERGMNPTTRTKDPGLGGLGDPFESCNCSSARLGLSGEPPRSAGLVALLGFAPGLALPSRHFSESSIDCLIISLMFIALEPQIFNLYWKTGTFISHASFRIKIHAIFISGVNKFINTFFKNISGVNKFINSLVFVAVITEPVR